VGNAPNFLIGVAVNPNEPDLDREVERFRRKIEHGADFAMTQVFFEWGCWSVFSSGSEESCRSRYSSRSGRSRATSWRFASITKCRESSCRTASSRFWKKRERAPARRVCDRARDPREARRRAQGAYVIAPFKNPTTALELFEK
jgi:hypothetical protein